MDGQRIADALKCRAVIAARAVLRAGRFLALAVRVARGGDAVNALDPRLDVGDKLVDADDEVGLFMSEKRTRDTIARTVHVEDLPLLGDGVRREQEHIRHQRLSPCREKCLDTADVPRARRVDYLVMHAQTLVERKCPQRLGVAESYALAANLVGKIVRRCCALREPRDIVAIFEKRLHRAHNALLISCVGHCSHLLRTPIPPDTNVSRSEPAPSQYVSMMLKFESHAAGVRPISRMTRMM